MTNILETVLIGLAVIAFVTYRLRRWQSVDLGKLLQMPAILLLVAAISLAGSAGPVGHLVHPHLVDVAILGFELVVGVTVGWVIGRLTEIRTFANGTKSRLSGPGIAVFLGFVAVRIGLGVLAATLGASLAAMPAMALVVLAIIKGVQGMVVHQRVARHHEDERQRAYAETSR